MRAKPRPKVDRVCKKCGNHFMVHACRLDRNPNEGQFCSRKCWSWTLEKERNPNYKGKNSWELVTIKCKYCGKEFDRKKEITNYRHPEYCSRLCRNKGKNGEDSPLWKGGTRILNGYLYIKSRNHPNRNSDFYVAQHRLVMEKHIGRYLRNDEVIHHINGNRLDNRIENMRILTPGEHTRLHNDMRYKK